MWFIVGKCGVYTGGSLLRREAIQQHTSELDRPWDECKRRGDRAVKCILCWDLCEQQ